MTCFVQKHLKDSFSKCSLLNFISLIIILSIFFIFSPQLGIGQENNNFNSTNSDSFSVAHNLQSNEVYQRIYSAISDNFKKDIYKNMTFVYAAQTAYISSVLINSNYVYHDKPEFEDYLNKVLKEILPEDYKKNNHIHVYLVRDGSFNAFSLGSGYIFVNIGLFNESTDEATLAAILAHEFSHYKLNHSLYHHIAISKGEFDLGLLGESEKLSNIYSIKDELQADSMAMQLMLRSKYNIKAMMNAFEMMGRLENNQISLLYSRSKLMETDHPQAGERYNALQAFYNYHRNDTALYYIVSTEKFKKLKKEAEPEILNCLMSQLHYYECIERAFRFHLNEPDNITYVQYLLESIRKICYLDPLMWDKLFITERYYDTVKSNGVLKKVKMTDHLFTKFNFNVLPLSVSEASKIKAKFYWTGDLKFKTNSEAFDFFCRLNEALGDHENILSNALSYENDSASMKKLLRNYINFDNIKYRDFAQTLLNGKKDSESNNKLLVFSNFAAKIRLGRVDVPIQSFGYEDTDDLKCIVDSLMKGQQDIKGLFLPTLRKQNLSDYKKLIEIEQLTFKGMWNRQHKIDIFILNPEYWDIYKKYEVNEIEFINCNYFEERGGKKSIEAYSALLNENFKSMLSQNQVNKYLNLLISSAKIGQSGTFRFSFQSGEIKLDFSDNGYDSVINEIKQQMKYKKKYADELEYKLLKL